MSSRPLCLLPVLLLIVACDPGGSGGVIVPPCQNGRQDQGEAGVDCGGACGACAGATCALPNECASKVCVDEVCAPPACDDGVKNGTELQVDCGGTCGACQQQPTCTNSIKDGDETGVDCGGSCPACTTGDTCSNGVKDGEEEGVDCGGPCTPCGQAPTCDDNFENGDETDTDCGGSCPDKCDVGDGCDGGADCVTSVCNDGVCGQAAASCTNNTADGDETDKDCGGSCPGCATGLLCDGNDDCLSATCTFGVCRDPSCTDSIQNQGESDVDCGGPRCGDCQDERTCTRADDCVSGKCEGGHCVSCEDEIDNQDETDVDCGGSCPNKCANEEGCDGNEDCTSNLCIGGTCKPEGSSAGVCDIEADCGEGFYCEYTWNDQSGAAADWEHVCLAEREGADIGASCEVLTDCAGFGCFNRFCSAACGDDDDCSGSAVCASEENYFDTDGDETNDLLLTFEYCLAFQSPAGACMSHTDCGAGKRCTMYLEENLSGASLDPDGPYKAVGRCEAEIAGGAAEGVQCELDSDCKGGVCGRQGVCSRWCEASSECAPVAVSGAGTLQRVCGSFVRWGGGGLEDPTAYVNLSDCVALNGSHSLTPCGPGTATPFQCGEGEACQANFIAAGPDVKAKAEWLCFENLGAVATGGPCADGDTCQSGYCFTDETTGSKYCSRPCTVGSDGCDDAVDGSMSCKLEPIVERKGKYLNNGLSIGFCEPD